MPLEQQKLGKKIRNLRSFLGLNQITFADLMGVSQTTISQWESGEQFPDRPQIKRLVEEARRRGYALSYHDFYTNGD